MHVAKVKLELQSPYCQSRFHGTPKLDKELPDDYERRTWRNRLHTDESGQILIPALAMANSIKESAKFLSIQIPGKRSATWTKHFEAGIAVFDDIPTGIHKDKAVEQRMFVPSDGVRGSGKRVMKSYPIITPPLSFEVEYGIYDNLITAEVFAHHLQQTGQLIGIGAFRVRNNGVYGRFTVKAIEWVKVGDKLELPPISYSNAA